MNRASVRNPFTVLKEQAAALSGVGDLSSTLNSGGSIAQEAAIVQEAEGNKISPAGVQTHTAMYYLDNYNDPSSVYYRSLRRVKYYK